MKKKFTIVYKTYKNDLKWLEYSLLSLQKYLIVTDILEIIIYTHNIANDQLTQMLGKIKLNDFIRFRIIPVHYNYHGYIKQMVIKANCFNDVQTNYIVILDSDLVLQKPLLFSNLLDGNGKINWYYLDKKDEDNVVFSVWKKAWEDQNKDSFNIYYMMNSFPFLFTKESLKNASEKFIEMHNCDYETYCYTRCHSLNVNVEAPVTQIFDVLSTIFEEFEYLGYYCHRFSNDYHFISYYDEAKTNSLQNYGRTYFKQYWSHGGITSEVDNDIVNIIKG